MISETLGPIGESIILFQDSKFDETYSVSCLVLLEPGKETFVTGRTNSNCQLDFIIFIIEAIQAI